jgi:NTP pyrophosphatase (non-canonical NTP hydrolase)
VNHQQLEGLREAQIETGKWHRRNFPNSQKYESLLGILEEAGELAHAHLKVVQGIRGGEDLEAQREDAVGDLLVFLLNYCNTNSLDLVNCFVKTWNEVSKRDWVKYPNKGVA